jgi:hypothetical protein
MKKISLIITIAMLIVFTSCKKDRYYQDDQKPENMEALKVPSNFDWKTTKDIQLTLTAKSSGIVEVNNKQGISYQKAFLTSGQPYTMRLTVPSYENAVKLRFLGQESELELASGPLQYNFN